MKIKDLKKIRSITLADSEKQDIFKRITDHISKENPEVQFQYSVPSPFYKFSGLVKSRYVQTGVLSFFNKIFKKFKGKKGL